MTSFNMLLDVYGHSERLCGLLTPRMDELCRVYGLPDMSACYLAIEALLDAAIKDKTGRGLFD